MAVWAFAKVRIQLLALAVRVAAARTTLLVVRARNSKVMLADKETSIRHTQAVVAVAQDKWAEMHQALLKLAQAETAYQCLSLARLSLTQAVAVAVLAQELAQAVAALAVVELVALEQQVELRAPQIAAVAAAEAVMPV